MNTNLFSEGLTVIPCPVEDNIAIVINGITQGNHTEDTEWPVQVASDSCNSGSKDLESIAGVGNVPRGRLICKTHGRDLRCR